jgi:hypothetical protein
MRIDVRDLNRHRIGRITIDPAARPTRTTVASSATGRHSLARRLWSAIATIGKRRPQPPSHEHRTANNGSANGAAGGREVFLTWDTALDDAGQLRRCVACGCPDLFREKAFPQVTGFVVLLAFIGAIVGALGLATDLPVLFAMAGVLLLDIAILFFSRRRLVCYQCRSSFHDLRIARYHRPWDRSVADRYPAPPLPETAAAQQRELPMTQVQGARG